MSLHYLTHMANYAALYTVAATSSHAAYPITNIYNPRLSKAWRSNNVLSNVDITIDLGATRNVDLIGLANHNFTSGVTLAVAAGTTSGVSDYSTTITWREGSAYKLLTSPQTYRYWRIRITDTSNPDGFLEAGYLLLGDSFTPTKSISVDPGVNIEHVSSINKVESEFGGPYIDHLNERKRISIRWAGLNLSDRSEIILFLLSLKEETNPLFLIPDSTLYDGWYVRLTTSPNERRDSIITEFSTLTFMEEGSGKRMAA